MCLTLFTGASVPVYSFRFYALKNTIVLRYNINIKLDGPAVTFSDHHNDHIANSFDSKSDSLLLSTLN